MTSFIDYRTPRPKIYVHATKPVVQGHETIRMRAGKWRFTVKAFADEACKEMRYETCYRAARDELDPRTGNIAKLGLINALAKIYQPKMKAGEIEALAVIDHEADEVRFAYAKSTPTPVAV